MEQLKEQAAQRIAQIPDVDAAGWLLDLIAEQVHNELCTRCHTDTIPLQMETAAVVYPYAEPEKVQMSQEYSVSLFYHYDTKVLSPDTVFVYGTLVLGTAGDEEGEA